MTNMTRRPHADTRQYSKEIPQIQRIQFLFVKEPFKLNINF